MAEDAILDWVTAQARRVGRLDRAHPLIIDALMCAAIVAVSYVELSVHGWLGPRSAVIGLALCAPLFVRRRHPEASFAAIAVICLLQWLISVPQLADVAVLVALYCVADRGRSLYVVIALGVVEVGAILAVVRWIVINPLEIWVGFSGLAVAAAGLGLAVRQRRQLLLTLQERAARLEREHDQELQLAAAGERARIAREMHDIVSHNLTVMIALADGASYAMDGAPDQARPAIERVSSTGRQALGEMRRLLGVLRDEPEPGPLEPQPSLARLDELVSRVEAAGIPVSVSIDGDPRGLTEGVQLAVFRVAQEALTNTLKHAVAPTRATIALRCSAADGGVELEVCDDGRAPAGAGVPVVSSAGAGSNVASAAWSGSSGLGPGPGPGPGSGSGSGRGLPGMRERAAAYDGELEAGPLATGGWRVHLALHG